MQRVPQISDGDFHYLLTSGVAIELITGFNRHHHDLDIVVLSDLDPSSTLLIDVVTPQNYFIGMKLDPQFLIDTAYKVEFEDEGKKYSVLTVHPAILLVQKLTNYPPHPRRPKDIEDAAHLFYYWIESLSGDLSWYPIIQRAIQALPEGQREIASERLALLLNSATPIRQDQALLQQ